MAEILYIVLPAYNEAENINEVVGQWHSVVEKAGPDSRLVVIDDGSIDDTYEKLDIMKDRYRQLIPVTKPNSGHGATCLSGYRFGLKSGADYIFQTDSDGQTNPEEFWKFWANRKNYDFIIGARKNRQDGLSRIIVSGILKLVVLFIFGKKVPDSNCPFRLMRAGKLKSILAVIPDDFFLSNVLISTIAVRWKEKILWQPISFKSRQGGKNSINLKRILKIGYNSIADFNSVKKKLDAVEMSEKQY